MNGFATGQQRTQRQFNLDTERCHAGQEQGPVKRIPGAHFGIRQDGIAGEEIGRPEWEAGQPTIGKVLLQGVVHVGGIPLDARPRGSQRNPVEEKDAKPDDGGRCPNRHFTAGRGSDLRGPGPSFLLFHAAFFSVLQSLLHGSPQIRFRSEAFEALYLFAGAVEDQRDGQQVANVILLPHGVRT